MCGIIGRAARGTGASIGGSALPALRHRGPDGEGRRASSGETWSWELGHTRLAIVDLSAAGSQPMSNEDESLVMVFNGEIYNSPELRAFCESKGHRFSSSMDGEVILHLWEMEGPASLARLNGIFAVAIANTQTGEVVLARDPVGVKPLFYATTAAGSLWFGSELRALEALGAPTGAPDLVALAQFLSFLWIPDPRTPRSAAMTLPPGTLLRWTQQGAQVASYGEPLVPHEPDGYPCARPVDDLRDRLAEAARRQLLSDVPVGLMASGGVDSGLLWWATHGQIERAYTIDWTATPDFEGLDDDSRAVHELEQRFGTPVERIPGSDADDAPPLSGDLIADPAYQLTRTIARVARERGTKVLLSGQGGDELFAGYRRHATAQIVNRFRIGSFGRAVEGVCRRLPSRRLSSEYVARLSRALAERDPFSAYMQLCTYSTPEERAKALDCDTSEVTNEIVWSQHRAAFERLPAHLSFLRKVMALDFAVYLPGLGLSYADRAGMEFGVEIRVPWLDLDLVRWTLALPDTLFVRHGRGKWMSRDLAAQVLSPWIANRPKRGFSAPASVLAINGSAPGALGFRQGAYFARARRLLDDHLGR